TRVSSIRGGYTMSRHLGTLCLASLVLMGLTLPPARGDDTKKLRVLLIDGQNNHDWRSTSPWLKRVLEESGRFRVDVSSNLKPGDRPGRIENTVPFPPDLAKYDVVTSFPI